MGGFTLRVCGGRSPYDTLHYLVRPSYHRVLRRRVQVHYSELHRGEWHHFHRTRAFACLSLPLSPRTTFGAAPGPETPATRVTSRATGPALIVRIWKALPEVFTRDWRSAEPRAEPYRRRVPFRRMPPATVAAASLSFGRNGTGHSLPSTALDGWIQNTVMENRLPERHDFIHVFQVDGGLHRPLALLLVEHDGGGEARYLCVVFKRRTKKLHQAKALVISLIMIARQEKLEPRPPATIGFTRV